LLWAFIRIFNQPYFSFLQVQKFVSDFTALYAEMQTHMWAASSSIHATMSNPYAINFIDSRADGSKVNLHLTHYEASELFLVRARGILAIPYRNWTVFGGAVFTDFSSKRLQ
jgi:hypothetical protein